MASKYVVSSCSSSSNSECESNADSTDSSVPNSLSTASNSESDDFFDNNVIDNNDIIDNGDVIDNIEVIKNDDENILASGSTSDIEMSEDEEEEYVEYNQLSRSTTVFIACIFIYLKLMVGCSKEAMNCIMQLIHVS